MTNPRTIILTGCSSGIGNHLAETLTKENYKVIGLSRSKPTSSSISEYVQCNISDYESVRNAYHQIKKSGSGFYAIINCAGIASMNLALTTPAVVTERVIKTNLIGSIFVSQIFAPLLLRSGKGRIINFSTIAVKLGLKGESVYVASKAGVEAFSRAFAREMSPFGITVNTIAPGPIKTPLLKNISDQQINRIISNQVLDWQLSVSDVSDIVLLLLDSKSDSLSGQVFHVGGA